LAESSISLEEYNTAMTELNNNTPDITSYITLNEEWKKGKISQ
jgi:hypothetical protein